MAGKPRNTKALISLLKKYFSARKDIAMSFIFGSAAAGRLREDSDIDIGVYFRPKTGRIEIEEAGIKYETDSLWLDLERIAGREVDLIVLNRAPATIAESAISGLPVLIKDRRLFIEFMLRTTAIAEDFRSFIEDYWALKNEMENRI